MHPASLLLGKRMAIDMHDGRPEQTKQRKFGVDPDCNDEGPITDLPPHGDPLDEIARHVAGQQCHRPSLAGPQV